MAARTSINPEIVIIDRIADVPREEWNALLTDDDSPFVDWDWLFAMEESGSAVRKTGWKPCHVTIRDNQRLIGACPLYLKSNSMGEFVFDHGWAEGAERAGLSYYPKLMAGVPFTPHTGRRLLTAAGTNRSAIIATLGRALIALCSENQLSSVHVNFCAEDEAEALAEIGFLGRLGYQYHWQNQSFASFDDYLLQLKHKRRAAIRHERAALNEQGVTIRIQHADEIPDDMFRPMFELYRSTIDKLYWGRQYLTPKFFELARQIFKRHITFVGAWRGSELVAGTFNLQKAGVMYGRYWGCFQDLRFLHFNVCYYASIEHCIAHGLKRFEPGAGGEYKWLRGFNPALTRSAHYIAHGGLREAIARFLDRERREVEAWIALGNDKSQFRQPPPPSNVEQA
ncbi:MAG: N-acetyltransferase [Candidatus Binataceae bacterium]|nr:N-acetyltransferase [Candidatus Binataceae bacterium]